MYLVQSRDPGSGWTFGERIGGLTLKGRREALASGRHLGPGRAPLVSPSARPSKRLARRAQKPPLQH